MPVANHGDVWQKPSQLCNYLLIKIFFKVKIQISTVCTSTGFLVFFLVFFFAKKSNISLIPSDLEGFPQGIAE